MNKNEKQSLKIIITNLDSISSSLESIWTHENNKFENLTEGLQETPMGVRIDEDRSELESAMTSIEEAKNSLLGIIENTTKK